MRLVNPGVQDGSITPAKLSFTLKFDQLNQAANVAVTTWFTPALAGKYLLWAYCILTQAATTSSTLPVPFINWTDIDTNLADARSMGQTKTTNGVGTSTDDVATSGQNFPTMMFSPKAGVAVQISTTGYLSSGATPMQYALHAFALGPF